MSHLRDTPITIRQTYSDPDGRGHADIVVDVLPDGTIRGNVNLHRSGHDHFGVEVQVVITENTYDATRPMRFKKHFEDCLRAFRSDRNPTDSWIRPLRYYQAEKSRGAFVAGRRLAI